MIEYDQVPENLINPRDTLLDAVITIGEAARMTGLSDSTLRKYESAGVIRFERTGGGYRMLSLEDLERVRMIQQLIKTKGLTLAGIRRLWSLLPCWELKGCSDEELALCEVILSRDRQDPCWVNQDFQGSCDHQKCRCCEVYRSAAACTEDLKGMLFDLMLGRASVRSDKRLPMSRNKTEGDEQA